MRRYTSVLLFWICLATAPGLEAQTWNVKTFGVPAGVDSEDLGSPMDEADVTHPVVVKLAYIASATDSPSNAAYNCKNGVRPDVYSTVARASTLQAALIARSIGAIALTSSGGTLPLDVVEAAASLGDVPYWFLTLKRHVRVILVPLHLDSTGFSESAYGSPYKVPAHITAFVGAWINPCVSANDGAFGEQARVKPFLRVTMGSAYTGGVNVRNSAFPLDAGRLVVATETALWTDYGGAFAEQDFVFYDFDLRRAKPTYHRKEALSAARSAIERPAAGDDFLEALPVAVAGNFSSEVAESLDRVKFNEGVIGQHLIVLPDTELAVEYEAESADRPRSSISFGDPTDITLLFRRLIALARAQQHTLDANISSRFSGLIDIREGWDAPALATHRQFAYDSWLAEVDFLVETATLPALSAVFGDGETLGPVGQALGTMIEAEQAARSARRSSWIAAGLFGASSQVAHNAGNTALAQNMLTMGMSTTTGLGEVVAAAEEASATAVAALRTYELQIDGAPVTVAASTWEELHTELQGIYRTIPSPGSEH